MSRKSGLTERVWQTIVGGIRDGYTITDACAMANVSRSAFYKWLTDFPDFNKAVVEATDLQWKYANWRIRHGYRGYERHHLNRPSKAYQSPNNVPFDIPPVESEVPPVDLDEDEALWEKWSWENAY